MCIYTYVYIYTHIYVCVCVCVRPAVSGVLEAWGWRSEATGRSLRAEMRLQPRTAWGPPLLSHLV